MIDNIYVLFKAGDKYFNSYNEAFFYRKKYCIAKPVMYVFTPTMQECKRVGELENISKRYFKETTGYEYYCIKTGEAYNQLNLLEEA